jgi:hypothetical protein
MRKPIRTIKAIKIIKIIKLYVFTIIYYIVKNIWRIYGDKNYSRSSHKNRRTS